MTNGNSGNQFREDEIIVIEQLREGKTVRNIFPKIGGRLRLAHEENDQLSITRKTKVGRLFPRVYTSRIRHRPASWNLLFGMPTAPTI